MTKRILFFLILMVALNSGAKTIYVSTSGNDANPGTKVKPVSTLSFYPRSTGKKPT